MVGVVNMHHESALRSLLCLYLFMCYIMLTSFWCLAELHASRAPFCSSQPGACAASLWLLFCCLFPFACFTCLYLSQLLVSNKVFWWHSLSSHLILSSNKCNVVPWTGTTPYLSYQDVFVRGYPSSPTQQFKVAQKLGAETRDMPPKKASSADAPNPASTKRYRGKILRLRKSI